jgi:transcriptional regulator with XRE-family HTH domain
VSTLDHLWNKLRKSKKYREEFVAAQVKRGIPFQIRALLKKSGLPQEEIASRAGLTQGVISRAANPDYGNLTLNTLIRIAAGFDVAFIGKFVPFSELGRWFVDLSEDSVNIKPFGPEDKEIHERLAEPVAHISDVRHKRGRTLNIHSKNVKKQGMRIKIKARKPPKRKTYPDTSGVIGQQEAINV